MTATTKRVKKQNPIDLRMKGFWVQLCYNLARRSTAPAKSPRWGLRKPLIPSKRIPNFFLFNVRGGRGEVTQPINTTCSRRGSEGSACSDRNGSSAARNYTSHAKCWRGSCLMGTVNKGKPTGGVGGEGALTPTEHIDVRNTNLH